MQLDPEVVRARANEVREAMPELRRLSSEEFDRLDLDKRCSMRHNVIVLVEALASPCIHVALEVYGLKPRSYAECLREISQRLGLLCYRDLESLARLGSLLVHRYWVVRDELVYRSIKEDFKYVEEFVDKVEGLV